MIESVDNVIQLILAGACMAIALYRAAHSKERAWELLGLFAGSFFLGDLYWLLYLAFYHKAPAAFTAADLSWYTAYLFLMLLLIYYRVDISGHTMPHAIRGEGPLSWLARFPAVLWCIPVFTIGMCIFYMQFGDLLSNIITAALMTGVMWHAASGLLVLHKSPKGQDGDEGRRKNGQRALYIVTLAFCFTEYALWTSSCFWMGDTITNVYFWFDFLLSVMFPLFAVALEKALAR